MQTEDSIYLIRFGMHGTYANIIYGGKFKIIHREQTSIFKAFLCNEKKKNPYKKERCK